MYLLIFCAVFCLPTSLAFMVSFHAINTSNFTYNNDALEICTPHRFLYQRGDKFTMYLRLLDSTNTVNQAIAVLKIPSDSIARKYYFTSWKTFEMRLPADKITIDVELVTEDGCLRETILEGEEIDPTRAAGFKNICYNNICLGQNRCVAEIDAYRTCAKMKPKPCEATHLIRSDKNEFSSHRSKFYSTTAAPPYEDLESLDNTVSLLGFLDSVLYYNQTKKQNGAIKDSKGGNPSHFTVMMITSVIAAVALLALLIISIKHFCWKQDDSPLSRLILPINQNRYYENIIFRDGCQQENEQQEQRASQPTEPYYEEIDDQLKPSMSSHFEEQG